jgi:hypothetical protein
VPGRCLVITFLGDTAIRELEIFFSPYTEIVGELAAVYILVLLNPDDSSKLLKNAQISINQNSLVSVFILRSVFIREYGGNWY